MELHEHLTHTENNSHAIIILTRGLARAKIDLSNS